MLRGLAGRRFERGDFCLAMPPDGVWSPCWDIAAEFGDEYHRYLNYEENSVGIAQEFSIILRLKLMQLT
jgi:hypothetical protein